MSHTPSPQHRVNPYPSADGPLLSVQELEVVYRTRRGTVRAVDKVSFEIGRDEVFGLAGESGCGKSSIAHAVTRLLKPPAYITGGKLLFDGEDILAMSEGALRSFRWESLSIVFQSAMDALNPVLTVGSQITDVIEAHSRVEKAEARKRAVGLLELVGIDPERIDSYPHQLSGGMRQRAVLAIALALDPKMIIMDEPTTALDVVVQKQILAELQELRNRLGFSILFITHDLSLLVEISDRIGIMYAGEMVETAPSREIFENPLHPYTQRLMTAFPTIHGPRIELTGIPGSPPDLITPPPGCRFHPRCHVALEGVCQTVRPVLQPVAPRRQAACHLLDEKGATA